LSKARQIVRLSLQLIRQKSKALRNLGRIIGDPSRFYRGHAQEEGRLRLGSG